MTRYKALVVDFGGVLTSSLNESMQRFAQSHGIEVQHLVRAALSAYMGGEDALVTDFETGKTSEDDFAVAFSARLKDYSGVEVAHAGLVDRLSSRRSNSKRTCSIWSNALVPEATRPRSYPTLGAWACTRSNASRLSSTS